MHQHSVPDVRSRLGRPCSWQCDMLKHNLRLFLLLLACMVGRATLAEPRQGVPSSLWQAGSRHVEIARNDAIWEGFPDVTLTASGKLDDLPRFAVHSERWFDQGTRIDAEGLHIENDGAEHQYTQYHLYPPENANCPLAVEVEVKVLSNAGCAASLCIGSSAWVEFYPDHIHLAHRPEMREDVAPDRFHVYRFQRVAEGRLNVSIDGKHRTSWRNVDRATQPWLCFGNRMDVERLAPKYNAVYPTYAQRLRRYLPHHVSPTNTGHSVWRRLGVRWDCPNMGKYEYTWAAQKDGFPDRWYMENTLELARSIQNPHTSMNGCVELPDGRLFAVYYFADGAPVSCPTLNNGQPDRGHSCYVRGTFFSAEDFGRGFITDSGATQSWPEAELAEPKVVPQADHKPG